jgi:hypothetical protein
MTVVYKYKRYISAAGMKVARSQAVGADGIENWLSKLLP